MERNDDMGMDTRLERYYAALEARRTAAAPRTERRQLMADAVMREVRRRSVPRGQPLAPLFANQWPVFGVIACAALMWVVYANGLVQPGLYSLALGVLQLPLWLLGFAALLSAFKRSADRRRPSWASFRLRSRMAQAAYVIMGAFGLLMMLVVIIGMIGQW